MRTIVHDYAGHPGEVRVSRELARRGHEVWYLYAGYNQTPRGALTKSDEDPPTFQSIPLYIREPLQKYSLLKRYLQEREYGRLLAEQVHALRPDVVISANTPLDAQVKFLKASIQNGAKFVFWVQDVIGLAMQRILRKKFSVFGAMLGGYYIGIEKRLLRQSDAVVLISDGFIHLMQQWGIDLQKTYVIPNAGPIDEIPVFPRENQWAASMGINRKVCLMYAGTMGMKHNPELILELALRFSGREDVVILVISEGPGADWLTQKRREHELSNLEIIPYQPYKELPHVLASGDILLAILEEDAGEFSVPGKVLSNMCAARAQLLSIPEENLAARIVRQADAGIVVPSNDLPGFIRVAERLVEDVRLREKMGRNARVYAEAHFDIRKIGDQFEKIICQLDG